jgi:drug/metabolite transporter (DMT)-like permease
MVSSSPSFLKTIKISQATKLHHRHLITTFYRNKKPHLYRSHFIFTVYVKYTDKAYSSQTNIGKVIETATPMKSFSIYKNTFLYFVTVLIWGTTWYAIEFQLGEVAIEVSLIYRFGLAAVLILGLSKLKGLSLEFSYKQHLYIALLGSLNFCLNYFVLYEAQNYLTSAMTSIVFSMLLLVNIVNTRIFFGKPIVAKTYLGAALGITGIIALFWPEFSAYQANTESLYGVGLVIVGVVFSSLGNMLSVRNSNREYPIFQSSGFGMLYGTFCLIIIALFKGTSFSISLQPSYLLSLAYLSIFGTVIAFYSYFYLLKSIGPEKTSYAIVLFPVVSVIISSLFEGFVWSSYTISGFLLVGLGNLIMIIPNRKLKILLFRTKIANPKADVKPVGECV